MEDQLSLTAHFGTVGTPPFRTHRTSNCQLSRRGRSSRPAKSQDTQDSHQTRHGKGISCLEKPMALQHFLRNTCSSATLSLRPTSYSKMMRTAWWGSFMGTVCPSDRYKSGNYYYHTAWLSETWQIKLTFLVRMKWHKHQQTMLADVV